MVNSGQAPIQSIKNTSIMTVDVGIRVANWILIRVYETRLI